jgi:ectoine hydroxylase-related dioxygenase (phytanoyl-CoA dioxygenase family)
VHIAKARGTVERAARALLHRSTPTWHRRPNRVPWFDLPDALERVDRHAADPVERALFARWIRDGYFVVPGLVGHADIDEMIAFLDGLWEAQESTANLTLLDLREAPDMPARNVTHAELLAMPAATRHRLRAASDWRIHGLHYLHAAAARVFGHRRLRDLVTRLLGRTARPFAAINFMSGSQQRLHQDMAVFHIYPHDYLVGAWIACEDISADSGPLVLRPGSHRAGMFPGFTDYPQTNLRTVDPTVDAAYQAWVEEIAPRYPSHEFLARKGDVLLWHGMLLHGGAPVRRRGTTRKSMALHYTVRGADRGREVRGPFNW